MKGILGVLLLLFAIGDLYSQEIIPIEQYYGHFDYSREEKFYYKDVNGVYDKFLGTWRYQTLDASFEITFEKVERDDRGNYFEDYIYGKFKYIKNGQVIFDTTSPIQPEDAGYYIFGGMISASDLNFLKLLYDEPDIDDDYEGTLNLRYIPRTQKLDWKVYSLSVPDPQNPDIRITPYKVPVRMTLTRVN